MYEIYRYSEIKESANGNDSIHRQMCTLLIVGGMLTGPLIDLIKVSTPHVFSETQYRKFYPMHTTKEIKLTGLSLPDTKAKKHC